MDRDRPVRSRRNFRTWKVRRFLLVLAGSWITAGWSSSVSQAGEPDPAGTEPSAESVEFFETRVRPVLAESCSGCHGPKTQKAGLRLDSRASLLKGSDGGPVVLPGNPGDSPLVEAIRHSGPTRMPPKQKLSERAIADITEWIRIGAPWPEPAKIAAAESGRDPAARHWAFQPVADPPSRECTTLPGAGPRSIRSSSSGSTPRGSRLARRRPARPDPPRDVRPDRAASDPGRGRGLRRRPVPRGVRQRGRSPAGLAPLRRALGAPLARRGALCRHQGLCLRTRRRYPYSYTYRDYVIRSFNDDRPYDRFLRRADRRRPARPGGRPPAAGGTRIPDGRPPVPQ